MTQQAFLRRRQQLLAQMKPGHAVSQLHFGGGTPTFLSDAELQRVMQALRRAFRLYYDQKLWTQLQKQGMKSES